MFKAERFSAADWARLFREAGAKFVVPVAPCATTAAAAT
jgi:alpha-L-fucosidase